QNTYREISMAFLMLFLSFLMSPNILVKAFDKNVDIFREFYLVDEETEETEEKVVGVVDIVLKKHVMLLIVLKNIDIKRKQAFYNRILSMLFCPGEVAPPPEFS